MTTSDEQLAAMDRWSEYAPMIARIEPAERASFFATAPTGTVIELWDDLYKRAPSGDWIHLEELVFVGGYSEYREHDSSTAEYLASTASSEFTVVRVLRLGEAQSWN